MCPPELLHTLDAGSTVYIQESLQGLISGGKCREELDAQHIRMSSTIRRQSERDFPRGSVRNGLIDSTRCQSSERKGNFFLLMCIAHTADGELVLRHELGYSPGEWKKWLEFLHLYLAMEEWFHDSRPKDEVRNARGGIAAVIDSLQDFFPRKYDSHGYNIPKLHGLTKVQSYMSLFGSVINFYGGPGEASHKSFVKAPGGKTQRRVGEFASQTAGQLYNMMAVRMATKYVDIRLPRDKFRDECVNDSNSQFPLNKVSGKYVVEIFPDKRKVVNSNNEGVMMHGLHPTLLEVIERIALMDTNWNGNISYSFTGYTHASIVGSDGESISFNAHPFYHGATWHDWTYVHYVIEGEDGNNVEKFYPSKILGFIDCNDETNAVIQCSIEDVSWATLENEFVVPFHLCCDKGKEEIVPLSSLCHPVCVVPDFGADENNKYMLILPKGRWSQYFTKFLNK